MEYRCRLRIILAEKNMRQTELHKRTGISKSALSQIANDYSLPTFDNAYKICKELDVDIRDIWERIE